MTGSSLTIEIVLADGRTILATPLPEDQDLLQSWSDRDVTLTDTSEDSDTSGHKLAATPDITLDVEGHAMTLRLPNTTDVDALKKALAVGAVSATIVAAGAIAALQGGQAAAPAIPNTVHPVPITGLAPVNQPRADFQLRQEQRADEMLAAPVPLSQPSDVTTQQVNRVSPSAGTTSAAAAGSAAASAPSTSFEERKEHRADQLLEAPVPPSQPSDVSTD